MRINLRLFLVIFIFLIVIFLRLHNLRKNVSFGWDQEVSAFQVKAMIDNRKPLLIGPRIGPGKFFLPPLYYYLVTPFLLLSKFDPIGLYYCSSCLGLATGYVIFICANKIFDKKRALIASGIYFFSPLMVAYDRVPWNVNLIVISSLFCFLALINLANNENKIFNYSLLGIGIGLGLNAHFTAIFLFFISVIWLIYNKKISLFFSLTIFFIFIFILPLLIFDLRHQFFNYTYSLEFFKNNKELLPITSILILTRLIKNIFIALELCGAIFVGNIFFWGKFIAGILLAIYSVDRIIKNKNKNLYTLGIFAISISCFLFCFYNGNIPNYYYFLLLPIFILIISDFISNFLCTGISFIKIITLLVILIIISGHDIGIINAVSNDGLFNKQQVIDNINENEVRVTYIMDYDQRVGYAYLYSLKNIIINDNAQREVIIKYPVLGDIRKNDYKQFGNIGLKIKDKEFNNLYEDYFNNQYFFAFDLPNNLTVVECFAENSLRKFALVDKQLGSCVLPFAKQNTKIYFLVGNDEKAKALYVERNNNLKNNEVITFVPRKKDRSLVLYLINETQDEQINNYYQSIKKSLKVYEN